MTKRAWFRKRERKPLLLVVGDVYEIGASTIRTPKRVCLTSVSISINGFITAQFVPDVHEIKVPESPLP